ncbi:galactokinase/galactose-1-phosphate uridylyltransferase, family 2,TIGR01239 [Lachnospiraceae bacterium RM5]|nr:galactokinase/galactose-1-phosphate uridylyltransferase, family 2,TIGR01239 [Lachnospiraceae bacterium RM5]
MKLSVYFAPGKINLIGAYLEKNGGNVLSCALKSGTYIIAKKRKNKIVRVYSLNKPKSGVCVFNLNELHEDSIDDWVNHVKAVIKSFNDSGYEVKNGLDLMYYGNVFVGSGFSSSESFQMATAFAINDMFKFNLDKLTLAKICENAQKKYIDENCSTVDYLTVAMGESNKAFLFDTKTYDYKEIDINLNEFCVLIADVKKTDIPDYSFYDVRNDECLSALKILQKKLKVDCLCDVSNKELEENKELFHNEIIYRRAKYIINENERVKEVASLIEKEDVDGISEIMKESFLSLKYEFRASDDLMDVIIKAAYDVDGCVGSKISGRGYGRCTISLVEKDKKDEFKKHISEVCKKETGLDAEFFELEVGGGPSKLSIDECSDVIDERMIYWAVTTLVGYAVSRKLIWREDINYVLNTILHELGIEEYKGKRKDVINASRNMSIFESDYDLGSFLTKLLFVIDNYACKKGIIKENTVGLKDLFDSHIMNIMTPRPSEVNKRFKYLYHVDKREATDWFYTFSKDTNYIRRGRITADLKWKYKCEYGNFDITINLSKPEKDPRDIAKAKEEKSLDYPKCLLCVENEGYYGRANHPGRSNHRLIGIKIQDQDWSLQYSPYVYYNEHCIVLNNEHVPMVINRDTFAKLFDFIDFLPHYFVGSNADLPIVGGSILSHEHFQGGNYEFAMAKAPMEKRFRINGFKNVDLGIVKWPMSVIRLLSRDKEEIIRLADKILMTWKSYTDEDAFIYAEYNTITPIARKRGDRYELDLVLRNAITTKEYPFGVFHSHEKWHSIKKENIGLIEVMGLAILPGRLYTEMTMIKKLMVKYICELDEEARNYETIKEKAIKNIFGEMADNDNIKKHCSWVKGFLDDMPMEEFVSLDKKSADMVLKREIGRVFEMILLDAGVFKRDAKGKMDFERFIQSI